MGRKKTKKSKPPSFIYKVGEEVIYKGNQYKGYQNQPCTVIEHSKKTRKEYDKIRFNDGFEFETIPIALVKKENINDLHTTINEET